MFPKQQVQEVLTQSLSPLSPSGQIFLTTFTFLTKGQTLTFRSEEDKVSGVVHCCFPEVIKDLVAQE